MGAELYVLLLIALVALGAGYTQSVTGFGFGIFAMIFLPSLLLYTEANVLSSILSALTSLTVLIVMRKKVSWKNLVFPVLGGILTNYLAVRFVGSTKNDTLILLLGIALLILSVYFFFFSGKIKIRPTPYAGLIAGLISGAMNGLFAIGGPPVVIYFVHSEKDTDRYLATISAYFVLSGAVTVSMKAASGFVTQNVLLGLLFGVFGMLAGSLLGKLTRTKIKPSMIKKAVYGVMAASGLINIISFFL